MNTPFILLRNDFKFYNIDNIIKNNFKFKKTKLKYDNSIFFKYEIIQKKVKKHPLIEKTKIWYANSRRLMHHIGSTEYLLTINNMNSNLGYILLRDTDENSVIGNMHTRLSEEKYTIHNTPKFSNIITTKASNYFFQKFKLWEKTRCESEKIMIKYWLRIFGILYYCLKINGCYIFSIINYCHSETFDLIYLLLFLFKKIIIYGGNFLYCENFDPLLSHADYVNLVKKDFTIINKLKLDKLLSHLIEIFNKKVNHWSLLLSNREDEFLLNFYKHMMERISEMSKLNYNFLTTFNKAFFETYERIYDNNQLIKIQSNIKKIEGEFLKDIINYNDIFKCLEIEMNMGISSLYILSSRPKNITLISIDPNQTSKWNNLGVKLLKNNNLHKNHTLIKKKSYKVLPSLLENKQNTFDFIFINSINKSSNILLDFFYSDLLLKKNGIIIIDNVLHLNVNNFIKIIDTNYSNSYMKLDSPIKLACYKKIEINKTQ